MFLSLSSLIFSFSFFFLLGLAVGLLFSVVRLAFVLKSFLDMVVGGVSGHGKRCSRLLVC